MIVQQQGRRVRPRSLGGNRYHRGRFHDGRIGENKINGCSFGFEFDRIVNITVDQQVVLEVCDDFEFAAGPGESSPDRAPGEEEPALLPTHTGPAESQIGVSAADCRPGMHTGLTT